MVLNVNVEDVEGIEDDRLSIANLNEDETAYIANAMVILGTGDKKDDAVLVVIADNILKVKEDEKPSQPETETFEASIAKGNWDATNSKLVLTVSVTGSKGTATAIKSVKWSKDSVEVSGQTNATLEITTGGAGSYTAEVTYTVGSDTTEKTATATAVAIADTDLQ